MSVNIQIKKSFLLDTLLSLRNMEKKLFWFLILTYIFGSLVLAMRYSDPNIFSASGGVVTIYGILILVSISTPLTVEELRNKASNTEPNNPANILKTHNLQIRALLTSIVGTLIWAYGWLLSGLM